MKDINLSKILNKDLTSDEIEEISRVLNLNLVASLLTSISDLDNKLERFQALEQQVFEALQRRVQVDLENDLLPTDSIERLLTLLSKTIIDIAEVKRKVFNGKDLLAVDPLSKKDRALLDLLKIVDTPEKKEKLKLFLQDMMSDDKELNPDKEDLLE